ncbi:hypothetical protein EX30DRAFT_354602 [Ascodesmis nigricans]|uniref:RING-type domain-containing protein n=1 Tax=Ascodesmis nigricans TaxID=341454 RepID=A0A4S2N0B9_9PEZI|nr:hypothetical protein EX30DRAFT_354602 [Ascodesmis nigricans]
MGQGASMPRIAPRRTSRSSGQQAGTASHQPEQRDVAGNNEAARSSGTEDTNSDVAARLRRRRLRTQYMEHLQRIGNRLRPSHSSSTSSASTLAGSSAHRQPDTSTRNRLSGLRFRQRRSRIERSRSPSPPRHNVTTTRRRTLPPISRPIPLDQAPRPGTMSIDDEMMDISPVSTLVPPPRRPSETARRSRMSRARNSITSWPSLLSQELGSMISRPSSRRQSHSTSNPPNTFEPLGLRDPSHMDIDTPVTSLSPSSTTLPSASSRTSDSSALDSPPAGNRSHRHPLFGDLDGMDNHTRARPGEDQAAMLSRLLSVAAATTAASLVGGQQEAISEARDVGGDRNGTDGSFEAFLNTLRNGRLEAALRNGGNELGGGTPAESTEGGMPSLNFFRMFRFGSITSNSQNTNENEEAPARMVPVIIVGIRSVNPRDSGDGEGDDRPTPFFDALANLPMTMPGVERRSRLRNTARRGSASGVSVIPPSSPLASHGLDAMRANSSSSSTQTDNPLNVLPPIGNPTSPPQLPSLRQAGGLMGDNEEFNARRESLRSRASSRRLSSPEPLSPFMRPRTGSQSADRPPNTGRSRRSGQGSTEGTRSWIIYVLGGSYPENHPILTTPSLFTDEPTYEDMTLLSSLLGPAKPPVANKEDVESAGGTFTFASTSAAEYGPGNVERCLVCLADYEDGETCRQLKVCKHIFHQECIDQWLTTGRNSCPLCRGEGVEEKSKQRENDAPAPPNASTTPNLTTAAS